jgi:hypothetical protein
VPRHYQEDYRQHYTTLLVVAEARLAYRRFEDRVRKRVVDEERAKYSEEVGAAFDIPHDKRTPPQEEMAAPLTKAVAALKLDKSFTAAEREGSQSLEKCIAKAVMALPEKDASQNIPFDGLMEIPSASVLVHHAPELIPEVRVLRRGELSMAAERVTPGVPVVLGERAADFSDDPSPFDLLQSRRKLALWLSRPDHPLTARVLVNRLWVWHFGRGIVTTPNDFGRQGQPPSHPELLDWLAPRSSWTAAGASSRSIGSSCSPPHISRPAVFPTNARRRPIPRIAIYGE